MSKPREFWIYKGTSNFCSELEYNYETGKDEKSKTDGFYDVVSEKDTIEGGIHVIEYSALKHLHDRYKKDGDATVCNLLDIIEAERAKSQKAHAQCAALVGALKEIIDARLRSEAEIAREALAAYKAEPQEPKHE